MVMKGKGILYSAIYTMHSLKALRHGSHSFICKMYHACLSFVSAHQMAPSLTEVADVQLQLTIHLSCTRSVLLDGASAVLAVIVCLS